MEAVRETGAEWEGGEESVSSLKERNGRIGAFPPRGYSTFMTRQRDREKIKDTVRVFFMPVFVFVTRIDFYPVQL